MLKKDTYRRKWTKDSWWFLGTLISLICLSLIVQIILVSLNVINWNWITGFTLAATFSTIALLLIRISVSELIRTENYYYYLFLFVARFGLYFIPFLMAVYIPNDTFGIFGVLWGFIPMTLIPLMGVIPSINKTFKKEHNTQLEG